MYGPLLKLERANYHIDEFERVIRSHIETHIKPSMANASQDARDKAFGKLGVELPKHTPTILGDAIHNLRVSLDHAYWIMVESNGGTFDKHVKFPFGKDAPSTKGSMKGQAASRKPKQDVIDFIFSDLQPFEGGALNLYDLHQLDIMDKHEVLLPNRISFTISPGKALLFHSHGDRPRVLTTEGGSEGTRLILAECATLFHNENGPIEYTGDMQQAFSVLFGDGPLKDRPMLQTLRMLSENVTGAVKSLAAFL